MNAVLKPSTFQVKMNGKWEDMELGVEMDQLNKELTAASGTMAGILAGRVGTDLQKIHQLVLNYHGATKRHISQVFDIICVNYKLGSFEDDVLKFSYSFILRYGSDKDRERGEKVRAKHAAKEAKTKSSWPLKDVVPLPRTITGEIVLMPGN